MKWGRRKKRDITTSRYKTAAKLEKKANKILNNKKKSKNIRGVLQKMSDELESSKTYKEAAKYGEKFRKDYSTKGVTIDQINENIRHHNKVVKE